MAKNESNIGKVKGSKKPAPKKHATRKGKSSNYNAYMNTKLAELKEKNPSQAHADRLKEVVASWKAEQKQQK